MSTRNVTGKLRRLDGEEWLGVVVIIALAIVVVLFWANY